LGRDAQSSGDTVMAESYYQFADHYYRVWLAAQPPGQPIQFSRRMGEEEFEDETPEGAAADGDEESAGAEGEAAEGAEATGEGAADQPQGEQGQGFQPRQNRFRDNNREGGNRDNQNGRDRFQRRWPRRFDRNSQDGQQAEGEGQGQERGERQERFERPERQERFERQDRSERVEREERQPREAEGGDQGNWEAPSFLKRPAPQADETGEPQERPRVRRPARAEAAPPADEPAGE
jgi:hypothetical protein